MNKEDQNDRSIVKKKYHGKYITMDDNWNIITCSMDPVKAYEAAKKLGYQDPILFFVQGPNMTYIYAKDD